MSLATPGPPAAPSDAALEASPTLYCPTTTTKELPRTTTTKTIAADDEDDAADDEGEVEDEDEDKDDDATSPAVDCDMTIATIAATATSPAVTHSQGRVNRARAPELDMSSPSSSGRPTAGVTS